jgi:hypothetical protein
MPSQKIKEKKRKNVFFKATKILAETKGIIREDKSFPSSVL